MLLALILTALAICGIAAGVLLGQTRDLPPRVAGAGGGLLFGISLFWMLPEMAQQSGWIESVAALSAGAILLWLVDHFLYPICPSCSHSHDHHHCAGPPLHGFAAPILIATGIHSLLDGWSVQYLAPNGLAGFVAPLGLALHKIPEGLAVGIIAREAMSSTKGAAIACVIAESMTLAGAWIEPIADRMGASRFGPIWITGVLALIGGSFLFLGFHTAHASRKQPGVVPIFLLALAGVACLALVHWRFGML
jgi:zinc transporter ZupT